VTGPLIVTPGDPAGIGPEVAVAALRQLDQPALLVGDAAAIERWSGPLPRLSRVEPVAGLAILEPTGDPVELASVRLAAEACIAGRARALVTGPIHKGRLVAAGHATTGHTELLGSLCGAEPVMAFVGGELRVALVTTHLPLMEVGAALTAERIQHTVRTAAHALRTHLGLSRVRIAVCGLNPHAGDDGALGHEEQTIIGPALDPLRTDLDLLGPISAEAAFLAARRGEVDLVVAMYHDQGLAPLKAVDFGRSVNWTLGLPIVRTSVDHGTAYDLAGRGVADPSSMVAAVELALHLSG